MGTVDAVVLLSGDGSAVIAARRYKYGRGRVGLLHASYGQRTEPHNWAFSKSQNSTSAGKAYGQAGLLHAIGRLA
jgi:hypothetical protein